MQATQPLNRTVLKLFIALWVAAFKLFFLIGLIVTLC